MYNHLKNCQKILISGCGGGYDIFCGLDLFFNLYEQGKNVLFGSYTFTDHKLLQSIGFKIDDFCYKITHDLVFDENMHIEQLISSLKIPPKSILAQMGCTREEYISSQIHYQGEDR